MDDSTVVMLPVVLFVGLPSLFGLAALVALMRARHRRRNLGTFQTPLLSYERLARSLFISQCPTEAEPIIHRVCVAIVCM